MARTPEGAGISAFTTRSGGGGGVGSAGAK